MTDRSSTETSWGKAYGWAFGIFLFFGIATAWFPSWLMAQKAVTSAPRWVADMIGTGAWFVPLAVGVVGLRWLQKTDRI